MPCEGGLKTMKLKEPCRSGFVRGALPDDLGNEEEMGGREGRPPQPNFLNINLSPLMINTKFHNGIKKGFDVSTEKVPFRQGEGTGEMAHC